MDQKQNKETVPAPQKEAPKTGSNKALWWILGGCLVLFFIVVLIVGGLMYWGYIKVKKGVEENQPKIENQNKAADKIQSETPNVSQLVPAPANTPSQETPQSISEESPADTSAAQNAEGALPFAGEKQIGYVKKVFTKAGKNYINIDYIQWLTGAEAQKAMREDGACPKTGECIVYDDYYIRNVNPLIRTFEISPEAEITMQTYTMETTGQIQAQKISFAQFSQIWSTNLKTNLKDVPYIIEISSNQITKINEQYIP